MGEHFSHPGGDGGTRRGLRATLMAGIVFLGPLVGSQLASAPADGATPTPPHIMVLMMENEGYSDIVGNPAAPYLNQLAKNYTKATDYTGVGHYSLDNYLAATSGHFYQPSTGDCSPGGPCSFGDPTLAGQMDKAGIPWAAYMGAMAGNCRTTDQGGPGGYGVRHDPFVYFPALVASDCGRIRPAGGASTTGPPSALNAALSSPGAPDFVWFTPSICHDAGHDASCSTVAAGDRFLSTEIPAIQATPWYSHGGQIVLTFDESSGGSQGRDTSASNRVLTVLVSAATRGKGAYSRYVNHFGLLAGLERAYGLSCLASACDTASNGLLPVATASSPNAAPAPARAPAPVLPGVPVTRLAGTNRVQTAVAVSREAFPTAHSARVVVLARDDLFPDALTGGPLAATRGGPVLLTGSSVLAAATLAEIQRALPAGGSVYVLGGTRALRPSVVSALTAKGYQVHRLSGATRFSTAVAVARTIGPSAVLEADGRGFADALTAGSAAAAMPGGGAVLLTNGRHQGSATSGYLSGKGSLTRYAVGGPAAAADPGATALAGSDRLATAVSVARRFYPSPAVAGLADGATFADALTAGPLLAREKAPLLLVNPTGALPAPVAAYLAAHRPTVKAVQVFGGSVRVTIAVAQEVVVHQPGSGRAE
ncbi:MAG: cell wall-binding repeat-containing protein [Acidimicrobiales bacterium]